MRRTAAFVIGLALAIFAMQAGNASVDITPSRASVPLNGPWAFRLGDDPRWASATFDDGDWERVDLTPKPGAHDGDVGLPDYVPGWTARGHGGRWGHAWYRLRVRWSGNAGPPLVLLGPTLVDDAYEIYWNGKRLGGIGDFSTTPPRIYGVRPQLFELGEPARAADGVLAIRVYLSKESAGSPEAGGVHVAPILAERSDGQAHYLAQWWRTFWGYVVDLVEPLALLGVAIFALSLRRFAPGDPFLPYAAGAIAAIAASRINQPLYFWTGAESLQTLIWARFVVFGPLAIVLWIMACNRLGGGRHLRLDALAWVSGMVAGISALPSIDSETLHSSARPRAPGVGRLVDVAGCARGTAARPDLVDPVGDDRRAVSCGALGDPDSRNLVSVRSGRITNPVRIGAGHPASRNAHTFACFTVTATNFVVRRLAASESGRPAEIAWAPTTVRVRTPLHTAGRPGT